MVHLVVVPLYLSQSILNRLAVMFSKLGPPKLPQTAPNSSQSGIRLFNRICRWCCMCVLHAGLQLALAGNTVPVTHRYIYMPLCQSLHCGVVCLCVGNEWGCKTAGRTFAMLKYNFRTFTMPPVRYPPTKDIETSMPAAQVGGAWLFSWSERVPIRSESGKIERYERRQVWTFAKNGESRNLLRF